MANDDELSGNESEGWLHAFEGELFEKEDEELLDKRREAQAFAAKRREMAWRFTHNELYDRAGQGLLETALGPVHFERGQGQQGRAWDCSLVLAKYLEKRPEEVRGKGVLELGCGVGLPGVVAAVAGAEEVILTDMAAGLPAIERTIELNPTLADRISGGVLQWGNEGAVAELLLAPMEDRRCPVSVVLCSDLLYGDGPSARETADIPAAVGGTNTVAHEREGERTDGTAVSGAAEALAITLSAVCAASAAAGVADASPVILSCHERRWAGDKGAFFFETMAQRGFDVEIIDPGDIDEQYRGDCGISFTRLTPRREARA